MAAVPVKPQYGPTLGRLLSPRWHRASALLRATVIAAIVVLVLLLVAIALTFLPPSYSHGGPAPFAFTYRDLYRAAPEPGQYVRVQTLSSDGKLKSSFAVAPLRLPGYRGELSGELPVFVAGLLGQLALRHERFELRGEGKGTVNGVPSYSIYYAARVDGRTMYGRDVLLLPERRGARDGVDVTMLTRPSPSVRSALEVASTGPLSEALKSLSLR